ncbi:HET-domain-containing protein [Venturia nashicola]|uniref:HET-domain-containing protein n=1 Tax=Venturia nashicola TaxID=86259 RepID=A0A4Z1P1W5_9PEZI|nr:HET-domain-containing protein [Venturia nashicola]TLD34525.1 HET-domain-containing protein [Venturia nashicola]
MAQYKYQPLETGRHEIRLFHLHPGQWLDQICCHLTTVSLDDKPKFEALSYVWGDPKDVLSIDMSGNTCDVTRNLEAALRRLRKKDSEQIVWIDQLCINQEDVAEKSQQVALMQEIYRSCEVALFWLGIIEDAEDMSNRHAVDNPEQWRAESAAASAVEIIRQLGSGKHYHEMACFQVLENSKLSVASSYTQGFEAIKLISRLPYWERAWVLQENILPTEAIAYLGSYSMPWKSFKNVAEQWNKHFVDDCCRLIVDTLPVEIKDTLLHFVAKILPLIRVSQFCADETSGACLADLLLRTRLRKATDDRDKVFSVLGLVRNWLGTPPIRPDYSMSTMEIYALVAEHFIRASGSLFLLSGNHRHRPHIPSWIADWGAGDTSMYPGEMSWGEACFQVYNAAAGKPAVAKRHEIDASVLQLRCYRVDAVALIGDPMEVHDWNSAVPILDSWIKFTGVDNNAHTPYIAGSNLQDAFWRCVTGNICSIGSYSDHNWRQVTSDDYARYKIWEQEIRSAKEGQWTLSDESKSFLTIAITARHRRLFVTKQGYLGMGPASTQVDDDVYVLLGSRVPFVTRKSSSTIEVGDLSTPRISLIGECYVHGIMDGEIISGGTSKQETLSFC